MEGSPFIWNLLTDAFSTKAGRNKFFKTLFANIFACFVLKHSIPIHRAQTQKEQKDAFTQLWKIGAFKPRGRQTTKALTSLEISEKTLKRCWRSELNIFCPSFFPPIPLAGHSTMPGSSSPGAQGHHCLAKSPHPPVAWLKEPCSIPGTFSLLVTFFFFWWWWCFFCFVLQRSAKVCPPLCHLPPVWKG